MAMSLAYPPSSLRSKSSTSSPKHHQLRPKKLAAVVDRKLPVPGASLACSRIASESLLSGFAQVKARIVAVGSVCWRTVRGVRYGVATAGGVEVRPWREVGQVAGSGTVVMASLLHVGREECDGVPQQAVQCVIGWQ